MREFTRACVIVHRERADYGACWIFPEHDPRAQAVIGIADGTFQRALGNNVTRFPKLLNAGASVIEALFAGQIDLS